MVSIGGSDHTATVYAALPGSVVLPRSTYAIQRLILQAKAQRIVGTCQQDVSTRTGTASW
jgi:hypothetical protein